METHRLKSTFSDEGREYLVQTSNDAGEGAIYTELFINGKLAERAVQPHPELIKPDQVLSLLKHTHGEKKKELEVLLEVYKQAVVQNNPAVLSQLGIAFYYKRILPEAELMLKSVLKMEQDNHQVRHYLSLVKAALEQPEEAVGHAAEAVAMRPGYADYRCNYGETLLAAGRFAEAITEFEEAIKLNLYYGDAYLCLAQTLLANLAQQSDTSRTANVVTRANDCLKKAALIHPDYDTAHSRKATAALHEGRLHEALSILKQVREEKKEKHRREFAGFYMKFVLHPDWVSAQVIDDRVRYLEEQIKKNPTYVDLYVELSRCYLEQARMLWKKGIDQYRKTLEISPSLTSAADCLKKAESEYFNMCTVLDTVAEKS